jgi:glycosyl transferase family 87
MAVVSHGDEPRTGLIGALRQLRDPLLLFAVPVLFAILVVFGYHTSWPIGFDFRGTLWEPARALLDGAPIYPEPTRDAVVVGNPADYPPLFILLATPFAALPIGLAAWAWFCLLAGAVYVSMRILEVRDWRCLVLAVTSPVVVHGLYFGNLTILLLVPLALAWRYREQARIAGVAVGVAIAAKLFVWPLVVWLLLTRRFRAAAWAVGSSLAFVLGAWAVIGFEGMRDYPALLREVDHVYAIRSISVSTAAGAVGAPETAAVGVAVVAGLICIGLAARLVGRPDGDRRSFTVVVAACILASPIVWPNYIALLLVPIAITWPRLAPAWFLGYAVWVVAAISPKPVAAEGSCCRPPGVNENAWGFSHSEPVLWFAAGAMLVVAVIAAWAASVVRSGPTRDRGAVGVERT